MGPRFLHKVSDFSREECDVIIQKAIEMKSDPRKYSSSLQRKTILMMFEKPSLRTRVSLESGTNQLGGHAIFYSVADSPLGKMKENFYDTAKTASRYVDLIAARLYKRSDIRDLVTHSSVPVINLLDDYAHPCQILADLQTIAERKDVKRVLKLSFFGDGHNNVTYDLMRVSAMYGWKMDIACPDMSDCLPEQDVMDEVAQICKITGAEVRVIHNVADAARNADIIYTDTWMSYHQSPDKEEARVKLFSPFRVDESVMKQANPDAIFMHCLPATRGNEMTAEVIDGPQSIVYDQAENRLHVQKAIMLFLLNML